MAKPRKVAVDPETLRRWLELAEGESGPLADDVRAILTPLCATATKPRVVPVQDFIALGKDILGDRFVLPERISAGWCAKTTSMLRTGGITGTMEAVELLEHCASWMKVPYAADAIAGKSGSWLATARATNRHRTTGENRIRAPMELEV